MHKYEFDTLEVSWANQPPQGIVEGILHVRLNRPSKLNALSPLFWAECRRCFEVASVDNDVRCVVLSAEGRMFCAGLDLQSFLLPENLNSEDVGRKALHFYHHIKSLQEALTAIAECLKPVVAVIHSGCVGAGVDLVSACDIRVCSEDVWFSIKEVAVGLAADVGTLQRFPKVVGNDSVVRELAMTARKFEAPEALRIGFVSSVHPSAAEALQRGFDIAAQIVCHSPLAVVGTKYHLNYSRDHSVADGLEHIAVWNAAALQSSDVPTAMAAAVQRHVTRFAKL
jgi:delta(3,5)-delta(2,4)-dienoyl-CoA isomerase